MQTLTVDAVEPTETCGEMICYREQKIRDQAYQLWQEAGEPCCDGSEFWFEAEKLYEYFNAPDSVFWEKI